MRVVFDTNVVISALVFKSVAVERIRAQWIGACKPLASDDTITELLRVLRYRKFGLSEDEMHELLGDYLPYVEHVKAIKRSSLTCRDPNDQMFLDLANSGRADVLVSGDKDLLALRKQAVFEILTPAEYLAKHERTFK